MTTSDDDDDEEKILNSLEQTKQESDGDRIRARGPDRASRSAKS